MGNMFSGAMNLFYLKGAFSHVTFKGLVLGMMLLKLVTVIAIQVTLKVFSLNVLKKSLFLGAFCIAVFWLVLIAH